MVLPALAVPITLNPTPNGKTLNLNHHGLASPRTVRHLEPYGQCPRRANLEKDTRSPFGSHAWGHDSSDGCCRWPDWTYWGNLGPKQQNTWAVREEGHSFPQAPSICMRIFSCTRLTDLSAAALVSQTCRPFRAGACSTCSARDGVSRGMGHCIPCIGCGLSPGPGYLSACLSVCVQETHEVKTQGFRPACLSVCRKRTR
jgi:hypothetical protein